MEAYHLALFGEGNCPGDLPVETEPGVGDKRKWAEANKPVCVSLGGDRFSYSQTVRASNRQALPVIREDRGSFAPSAKKGLLGKTRQASQRLWLQSKSILANAASLTSRLASNKQATVCEGDEVREPPYKRLKLGTR